jgi:bifunctional non-homologous end joining protein LigD
VSRSVGRATKPTTPSPGPLGDYRAKRDPKKTPEPMGKTRPSRKPALAKPTFVIQEHHARALHWDFRLEHDGVLVSWALPKGLPLDPNINHLAVHTEDHPLEYGSFAGTIPKGEYGAGKVTIWDHGWYELEKWRDKEVMIVLHGARAKGRYVLFPTGEKNWMIHRMDPAPANYEPMPQHIAPMLVLANPLPKNDDGWAYEFKWDGVRAMVYVDGGRVRALTRNDKTLTTTFPELREIGEFLGSRSAILDGEIVTLDKEGRPSFAVLAHRLHLTKAAEIERLAKSTPVSFFAFDLLYLDGHNFLADTYDARRAALNKLKFDGRSFTTPPSSTDVKGSDMLRIAKERGLEGVVVKRRTSRYAPGQRNGEWIKIKNFHTQEVVIGGWTAGQGERAGSFGALLLGVKAEEGFTYIGKVGTGFSAADRRELLDMLKPLARKTSPFVQRLSPSETAQAHFVRPSVVGEVRFAEWTVDGNLRQPAWRGLRTDKSAKEVIREP